MTWLYALILYPILPLMYFQMRNETKPKKNIVLGVTLPYSALQNEEVLAISEAYKRKLTLSLLLLHIPLLLMLLAKKVSFLFGGMLLWLTAVLGLFFLLYVRCHNRLRLWKRTRNISQDSTSGGAPVCVDVEAIAKGAPQNSMWLYLPALLIALALPVYTFFAKPEAADRYAMLLGGVSIALPIGLLMLTDYVLRRRSEAVNQDSALNAALTQARRGHWSRCCLWCSYLTALLSPLLFLIVRSTVSEFWGMVIICLYMFVLLFVTLRAEFACRHAQERLAGSLKEVVDTDEQWLLGMFYNNPEDKRLLVHSRVGTNSTFNLARPAGKLIMVFCVLSILVLPFSAVLLISEETSPVAISMQEDTILLSHGITKKSIPMNEIQNVELLETLPRSTRIVGTGLPTLLKGKFAMQGYEESCYFCLNPKEAPFVTFLYNGTRYVLNYSAAEMLLSLDE